MLSRTDDLSPLDDIDNSGRSVWSSQGSTRKGGSRAALLKRSKPKKDLMSIVISERIEKMTFFQLFVFGFILLTPPPPAAARCLEWPHQSN